ncbi:hypothetical protein [Candidatus Ishikawella capsulata]|nr:hypothetical protein [Candidatus Ishikawaella capsulata]
MQQVTVVGYACDFKYTFLVNARFITGYLSIIITCCYRTEITLNEIW